MNVYDATQIRIKKIFDDFDNICVSFSGGKDSGVLLNLFIDYIRNNKINRKINVFHIDYEAQYNMTTEYVDRTLLDNLDIIEVYRCCMPILAQCATSIQQKYWKPWEYAKENIWVRDMPENGINEKNHNFDFFNNHMWDYEFQEKFALWLHKKKKAKKTACLIGIRTQESLNRWRAIHSEKNYKNYNGIKWTKLLYENIYNLYPIYDWKTEDIWIVNKKFSWDYNKLYDLFYQSGLSIAQMRVASPFNNYASESLKLYKTIDPNMWGKMIGRVNGVNFTGIYGGTTAMGWHSIKLPIGHTWKSYMEFLLSTMPESAKNNYINKLETSIKFWKDKGGVLSIDVINKLKNIGIPIEVLNKTNYDTNKLPVKMEYIDEIDIEEAKEIPTYKRMCICIMKNDHLCKYMGFAPTKKETIIRNDIMNKYKNL